MVVQTSTQLGIGTAVALFAVLGVFLFRATGGSTTVSVVSITGTTTPNKTITTNSSLNSGLIAHWTFDGPDMITNVSDRSGNNYNGALQGQTSTTTAPGIMGQALSFDGVDDYVNMGDNDGHTGMSAITISIWVYFQEFDSTNDEEGVIGKDRAGERAYGLFIGESDLKPLATFSDDGTNRDRIDFDTALTPNAWNHIVVTWDGSNIYAYNNGLPDGSQVTSQTTGTIFNSADDLRIGDLWDTDDRFFTGRLDDARIYNRALSDDEVSRLHGLGSSHTSSVTAELPKTFQETCWDDNGASRSCSGTGEDGEIRYGITPPSNRFIDNGDGTILDLYTQIIWLKDADCFGADLWQTALDNAAGLNTGECGLTDGSSAGDWNVPNLWQLSSLQDHEQSGPGLPSGHPFTNVFNGTYWTNSTRVSLPGWAVSYSMNNPHYDVNDKDVTTGRTWPMRLSGLEGEAPVRLPKSGQTSCWDDAGVSRSCSGTGEDGELQHGFSYPSPRFTDNGDGTVTDNYTSLVWLKNAGCFTGKLWQTALDDAAGLNTGECGLTDGSSAGDWILPNFYQIMSLVDFENESPSLPAGHPFTNVQAGCHTSTTRTSVVGASWAFVFNNGTFTPVDKDVDAGCAWPVKR